MGACTRRIAANSLGTKATGLGTERLVHAAWCMPSATALHRDLDRLGWPPMSESTPTTADARRLAQEARDRVRFEEEALELSDQVYRVARRLTGSREEAEDLVQQAYERAFRSWRQYTPGTNLRAWLLRILTNLNIDRGRRQQRTPQTTSIDNEAGDYFLYNKLESQVPDENPDEERVLEKLSQDSIVDALAEVPHDFRDVIVLVDIGEFSYADAAQILDIPIGTVMSRLHRGRRILKKNLADGAVTA
jgi:RNA polymerase sigma-70 factor, ECF subfamily